MRFLFFPFSEIEKLSLIRLYLITANYNSANDLRKEEEKKRHLKSYNYLRAVRIAVRL